ncbi:hypothetical protein BpHYR1_013451 [Brachionus plicatilis]|uniref:Uncharacterized protein n=1 Tax=Brachionus plicatilis TaxID=10195 RepID=A0A3M7QVN1_BRAPC|nr:hypothetical protein BpHYR1_013451 [Brachionus plicatilis]
MYNINIVLDMSRIMWGIDNLAEKSFDRRKYNNKPLETMNVFEKLDVIKSYIIKTQEIYKMYIFVLCSNLIPKNLNVNINLYRINFNRKLNLKFIEKFGICEKKYLICNLLKLVLTSE